MRASLFCMASAFLSLVATQQPTGPNPFTLPADFMINAGEPTTITWTPTTGGTVSIRLRDGASSDLNQGIVVASDIENNGRAQITIPADTTRNSDYALQIVSGPGADDSNYSAQFVVESDNTVESVSSSPGSTTATSAASTTSEDSSTSSEDSSTTTESSSMSTTGASTRTSMSTMTGSSMTRSTGTPSATSEESSPTGETSSTGESSETVPSSGAMSLKVGGFLLAAMAGLVTVW